MYLLPLLAGLALIPGFPPLEQGWVAWFALIPLIRFCLLAGPGQAFLGGFLFGLPLQLYLNLYLGGVLSAYLSPIPATAAMILLVASQSLFYGLFALAVSFTRHPRYPLLLAAVIPALWVLMEYLRSLGFTGYNIGYLGYTQWHYQISLNLTAAFGYWGLSFVMVFFQSALLLSLGRTLRGKNLLAAAAIFLTLFCGGTCLQDLSPVKTEENPLRIALIQGCSDPAEILADGKEAILKRYLGLTRAALAKDPRVELVLWPETVVSLTVHGDRPIRHRKIALLAEELEVAVLYGAQIYSDGDLYNAIVLFDPERGDSQVYHKQRLVPFVEYFPLEAWLNRLLDLDFPLGNYRAGDQFTLFDYRGIPLAGVICFESYFGDYTRHFAVKGGRHLFVATNDVWFEESIGLEQHAQVAALRAAEMGIGVTQIANSGISISFDCRGRELLRTGKAVRGYYTMSLDLAERPTLYRASGEFFLLLCLLLAVTPAILAARKAKNPLPPPAVSRHRKSH